MEKRDPIGQFEHSHGQLSKLALDVGKQLRATQTAPNAKGWKQLVNSLCRLRDELLQHFADEEEGLFPFVRASVPDKAAAVEKLAAAHDTICGCVVRMVHVASGEKHVAPLMALYERFESTYGRHSIEENELFEGLARSLDAEQKRELAERLRGL